MIVAHSLYEIFCSHSPDSRTWDFRWIWGMGVPDDGGDSCHRDRRRGVVIHIHLVLTLLNLLSNNVTVITH